MDADDRTVREAQRVYRALLGGEAEVRAKLAKLRADLTELADEVEIAGNEPINEWTADRLRALVAESKPSA